MLHGLATGQGIGQLAPQSGAGSLPLWTPSSQLAASLGQLGPGHSASTQVLGSSALAQAGVQRPPKHSSLAAQVAFVSQHLSLGEQLALPSPAALPEPSASAGAVSSRETSLGSNSSRVSVQAQSNARAVLARRQSRVLAMRRRVGTDMEPLTKKVTCRQCGGR
jgi:hypothetical protein